MKFADIDFAIDHIYRDAMPWSKNTTLQHLRKQFQNVALEPFRNSI